MHDNFCIRDIEQVRAPGVLYPQRIIRHRHHRRFRAVYEVSVGMKFHFLRQNPCEQTFFGQSFCFTLVKTAGKTVLQKYRRICSFQQSRTQPRLCEFSRHIQCRCFKLGFVSSVNRYIIFGEILFSDII